MKAINLGSGQRPFKPPFINVDINPKWKPDVVADGAHMPMFEDGSVDLVVANQTYEHYGLGEATPMVRECHRILRVGGSLIVTTPNLRTLVARWASRQISDYIFCVNLYGAYMDDEHDRHRWLYTYETLKESLGAASVWSSVHEFDWRTIESADISRDWWILGMECVK